MSQIVKSSSGSLEREKKLLEAVDKFTEDYQRTESAWRQQNGKTAECVLDLCKVVYDAASSLDVSREYLNMFRLKNGLESKSTFSQFKLIGQQDARLRPHAASLPASWYTLYHLAKLDDASFNRAVDGNALHPLMTQREVKELGVKQTKTRKDFHLTIQIVADEAFAVAQAVAFNKALIAFLREQHGKWSCVDPDIRRSKALDAALSGSSTQKKAA
jgi:hypothetical protein